MIKNIRTIIFPASRQISANEQGLIIRKLTDFLSSWSAHGNPLYADVEIVYQQFIIIKIDENIEPASGCSLDTLNGMMREIEAEFQLGIFDRMKACFIENDELKTLKLNEFLRLIKNATLSEKIKVFDFSVANLAEYQERFLLPLEKSWANQHKKR